MGMRGTKPKPTVLKILQGNPGRRPLNVDEPHPESLDEACPAELVDPVAQAEWTRTIVPAIGTGQITAADRAMAIGHCELWAARRSQLLEGGRHANVIAAGKHGYPMPNPALGMANRTLKLLLQVDAELGLTPSSRSRVKVKNRAPKGAIDKRRAKFFQSSTG
jgi:P27 family predicted phage terminase small subunit